MENKNVKLSDIVSLFIEFSNKFLDTEHDLFFIASISDIIDKYVLLYRLKFKGNICEYLNVFNDINIKKKTIFFLIVIAKKCELRFCMII